MIANLRKRLVVEMKDVIRQKIQSRDYRVSSVRIHAAISTQTVTSISWSDFDDSADLTDFIGLQQFLENRLGVQNRCRYHRRSHREEQRLHASFFNNMIIL